MAKTVDLLESYMFGGQTFGPGPTVLPDDETRVKKIMKLEKERRDALEAEAQAELRNLPQGHPYQQLLGIQLDVQPPESEEGAKFAEDVAKALEKLGVNLVPFGVNAPQGEGAPASPPATGNRTGSSSGGSGSSAGGTGSGSSTGS